MTLVTFLLGLILAFVRLEQAMIDLSEASVALRNLADYPEDTPSALIRRRPGTEASVAALSRALARLAEEVALAVREADQG